MRSRLRKLFRLLNRRDKQWLWVILLFMLISSALEVVSIGSVPLLITLVADPARLQGLALVRRELDGLSVDMRLAGPVLAPVARMTLVADHNELNVAMRGIYASSQQKILVLVDVPKDRVDDIQSSVKKHHSDADFEGTEPTIPAFP